MDIRPISDDFSAAPQIAPGDMERLAQQGYIAVICNRPDGEEAGQPSADEIRQAAEAAGIAFHHIPVSSGVFPMPAIAAYRAVRLGTRASNDGKTLAYCRSGMRSVTMETMANPQGLSAAQRLEAASAAGYDLSGLEGRLAN